MDCDKVGRGNALMECPYSATITRVVKQLDGNGQPGVVQQIQEIHQWVSRQEGKEEAEAVAKADALILAAGNERKAARARSLAKWVAGAVFTCLITLFGWMGHGVWVLIAPPAGAIIREYWERHPDSKPPQHGFFSDQSTGTLNTSDPSIERIIKK